MTAALTVDESHAKLFAESRKRFRFILSVHRDWADDLSQEVYLACRTEAVDGTLGDDQVAAVRKHLGRFAAAERERKLRLTCNAVLVVSTAAVSQLGRPRAAKTTERPTSAKPHRAKMTPGQLKRMRRNIAIGAAHEAGMSQRMLAKTFGVVRSRIAAILDELNHKPPHPAEVHADG